MTTLLLILGAGWLFALIVVAVFLRGISLVNKAADIEEEFRIWDRLEREKEWRG